MTLSTTRLARVSERAGALLEGDVDVDPVVQFGRWFDDAEAAGVRAPNAMAIATATPAGAPSVRMVLLKSHGEEGFVFFTGYVSRKAGELDANPQAALLFYWDPLGRQVRVEGTVERVDSAESDEYFASRPRGAQLAAAASRQSSVVRDRDEIDARVAELAREHEGEDVPRPVHWGGYRLRPDTYEFWQHREDRAHDRLRYRRDDGGWKLERLSP
jgi:pyridoxamine 5'-phosphate oxidase